MCILNCKSSLVQCRRSIIHAPYIKLETACCPFPFIGNGRLLVLTFLFRQYRNRFALTILVCFAFNRWFYRSQLCSPFGKRFATSPLHFPFEEIVHLLSLYRLANKYNTAFMVKAIKGNSGCNFLFSCRNVLGTFLFWTQRKISFSKETWGGFALISSFWAHNFF